MFLPVQQPLKLLKQSTLALALSLSASWLTHGYAHEPQPPHAAQTLRATQSLMLDIAHAGQRIIAVGDRGYILYSDDEGKTWQQAKVPTQQLLTAVYFVDAKHGWAVGHDALILHSNDGGLNWTQQYQDLALEAPLLDIWFADEYKGFAVGAYGTLLHTQDGGQHWDSIGDALENENGYHLNAITAVKGAGVFIVGEMGVMYRSLDMGENWETVTSPYQGSLFGVQATAQENTLLVYGLRGHVFRSTDFGDSWQRINLRTANGVFEFGLADSSLLVDGSVLIVGHGGSVLRSTDAGQSFSIVNRADRLSLAGVTATQNGNLILIGQHGIHLASPSGVALEK
ncbi:WD40/YVTN/BNR-like repeat-containing protein [Thiopseudomonas acetoxidans]|uniref:YCF48-related protein n=1 Tax=Thiopseudomonas acetoxidans TaxID=3041622 RepID=A0ABT7SMG1_9GAMM|nr:YCF48-related protein [Thiopseudomonas sp. CY1220]MDM7857381.1 YCF48-related protein [Thiopseudomonas sp. CY1220]